MNPKYKSIGLPSSHVVEILPVMEQVSKELGIKVVYPSYLTKTKDGWEPNYEIYGEPLTRPFPRLCWKSNLTFLEAEKMIRDDKVDALIIPHLESDRFRPCVGANGMIDLIKKRLSDVPLLSPSFFDDELPTLQSIESLVKELGGGGDTARKVIEGSLGATAFEKSLKRDVNKFITSPEFPTVAVISHFREIAMLRRLSEKFKINFVPLRELADAKGIPSHLVKPNPTFFQTQDVIDRTNELYRRGDVDGLLMIMDPFCTPRKIFESHLKEEIKAPSLVLRLDEFDYLSILKEGRLRNEYEGQIKSLLKEGRKHHLEGKQNFMESRTISFKP
ncbi:MAG: hypothetical protein UR23_C0028G0002 [Candidatus Roizmanbacteria bacterium GW2011_GWA2_32_13]|uniref:DUF2229 domain-containing protein n=1 Tax=Candidatus Roizmanbacteria bacterium GW2011_GWA2_32_13 TaxID=1618475 RepID=A0A0F9YVE6_9BACT|nr:MAG: hypothetical protein UR23_C0028G0002 [Candidatus Roizmanbacteria bacterium GW2011_GWA2_32_13]